VSHVNAKMKLYCLMLLIIGVCVTSGCRTTRPLAIAMDGQPRAVIVVADDARPITRTAARHFQEIVEQMSGAKLPIRSEKDYDGKSSSVLIGMSKLAKLKCLDVSQDPEAGDQYVIRSGKDWLALVGNDGGTTTAHGSFRANEGSRLCGSAYAVYDFLQRLGCGWYGPDPLWHVIPQTADIEVPLLQISERPDFAMRHIWMVDPHPVLRFAWRVGACWVPMYHNFKYLVPASRYKTEHPEWFGPGQPCLTEPAIRRIIVENFRKQLDASEDVLSFSICANDVSARPSTWVVFGRVGSRLGLSAGGRAGGVGRRAWRRR